MNRHVSGHENLRADQALALVEPAGWNRHRAGAGAKGPRYYNRAWIATASPQGANKTDHLMPTGAKTWRSCPGQSPD